MPVNTITYQPSTAQIIASYRPIVFKVEATASDGGAIPPFVSCDIYLSDVYYKSLIRTAPESSTNLLSTWSFDISDALQEYLQPDVAVIDNNKILQAPHASAKVFVRFRASGVDDDGFTVEEATKPVQGTKNTAPVNGTGLQSNTFFAINSALQHEDNQNLAAHMDAYKQGSWNPNAYPLTHRNRYFFCPGDSDQYPVVFVGDCVATDLLLHYRLKGQTGWQQETAVDVNTCTSIDFDVEVSGRNLTINYDDPIPSGQYVLLQYRSVGDTEWIDIGTFNQQTFGVNLGNSVTAGDYELRSILFCTACLSAAPIVKDFTLDIPEPSYYWRGINPYCLVDGLDSPVYIALELRNPTSEEIYYPNSETPFSRETTNFADLYLKFYSDPALLTPVSVTNPSLKAYIKRAVATDFAPTSGYAWASLLETLQEYIVSASGVEVLLANVQTSYELVEYDTYPTVSSTTTNVYTYSPYPPATNPILSGGNTGEYGYANLAETNALTDAPTGVTKPNNEGDPDYIPPTTREDLCPIGPVVTYISYGGNLEVAKVELNYNSAFYYIPPQSTLNSPGYQYMYPIPRNTTMKITIKGKTLDSLNLSGYIKVKVTYTGGEATFNVPNNIETLLPQTFQNVNNIAITNY